MELNLDYLYNQANALKNKFDDKETELIKVKDKKVTELKDDDKETDIATESIVDLGDAETATKVHQKDEGIIDISSLSGVAISLNSNMIKAHSGEEQDFEIFLKNHGYIISADGLHF